jgi:hypothetical protein
MDSLDARPAGPVEGEAELRAALRAGARRTRLIWLAVGIFLVFFGACIGALDLFQLDPELRGASLATRVALWAVSLGCAGLGALMGGMGLIGVGGAGRGPARLLFEHPEQLDAAWRVITTSKFSRAGADDEEGSFGQHMLSLRARDGKVLQVMMQAAQVTRALRYIRREIPRAGGAPR